MTDAIDFLLFCICLTSVLNRLRDALLSVVYNKYNKINQCETLYQILIVIYVSIWRSLEFLI